MSSEMNLTCDMAPIGDWYNNALALGDWGLEYVSYVGWERGH